ncbi:MAG: hypothetical protein JWO38_1854 [Gemmataceae bacterium]|nr:hypothetical protein [Gemmataceae bacterium]
MVPIADSSEVLRLFLAIAKAEIDRDIAETPDNFDSIWPHIQAYYRLPDEERTPEVHARHLHTQMIHACSARAYPQFPDIISIHLAAIGAREVAQVAVQIAESGELGRLNREIDRIREEAGVEDEEVWVGKEKPAGNDDLMERAGELLTTIESMMVVDVLRRYPHGNTHGLHGFFRRQQYACW